RSRAAARGAVAESRPRPAPAPGGAAPTRSGAGPARACRVVGCSSCPCAGGAFLEGQPEHGIRGRRDGGLVRLSFGGRSRGGLPRRGRVGGRPTAGCSQGGDGGGALVPSLRARRGSRRRRG